MVYVNVDGKFRAVCLSCQSELLSKTKIKSKVFCLYNKIVCFLL